METSTLRAMWRIVLTLLVVWFLIAQFWATLTGVCRRRPRDVEALNRARQQAAARLAAGIPPTVVRSTSSQAEAASYLNREPEYHSEPVDALNSSSLRHRGVPSHAFPVTRIQPSTDSLRRKRPVYRPVTPPPQDVDAGNVNSFVSPLAEERWLREQQEADFQATLAMVRCCVLMCWDWLASCGDGRIKVERRRNNRSSCEFWKNQPQKKPNVKISSQESKGSVTVVPSD
jgi:hypothetical protein